MEDGGGFHGYQGHPTSGKEPRMEPLDMKFRPLETINKLSPMDSECLVREQDRFMPIANVIRIMRKILPPHAKISDDAKETIQECVSEFISFITGEANDRCQREQRKTVTAEDILWAMSKLGFDDYIEPLTIYLQRYREFDSGERVSMRGDQPLVKSVVDPANPFGIDAFATVLQKGLLGPATIASFLKDPPKDGRSKPTTTVVGFKPYTKCKE